MALAEEDRCGTDGQSEKVAVPVVIMKMNVLLLDSDYRWHLR